MPDAGLHASLIYALRQPTFAEKEACLIIFGQEMKNAAAINRCVLGLARMFCARIDSE